MLQWNPDPVLVAARFSGGEVCRRIARKNSASKNAGNKKPRELRRAWRGAVMTILAATFIPAHVLAQKTPLQRPVGPPAGRAGVSNPRATAMPVRGSSFFIHAPPFG